MNTPTKGTWQRTSPFAVLFFLGKTVRLLAQNGLQTIAPLLVYVNLSQQDFMTSVAIGGAALAVAIAVGAILSWWFFRYQIRTDSVLIRSGVIKKTQLDIKFERIQGVNTQQNPIYRLLNLVTITFDTAGSSGKEGNLPAVTVAFADALRDQIAAVGKVDAVVADAAAASVPLLALDWRDMIRIGLSDRRALIVFALIGPLMDQMGDRLEAYISRLLRTTTLDQLDIGVPSGILLLSGIILSFVFIFALVSIAAAFLRYHNFKLYLDGRTLRSRSGLLTRHEHTMDLEKIQTLRLQQGIVLGWMGRFAMSARQAVSSERQRAKSVFHIPCVTAVQADQLRPLLFDEEAGRLSQDPRHPQFLPVSPHYLRGRVLFVGLLPALAGGALYWPQLGWAAPGFASLWLLAVLALSWRSWKRAGYCLDKDELVQRSGMLGYRTVGLLLRKVQRVTVSQSRYQRSKGLATLVMYMASGKVSVPYIPLATAQQLRDYILYQVESSQKAWH